MLQLLSGNHGTPVTLGFQRVAQPEPVGKEDLSAMCTYDSEVSVVSEVDMKGCKHAVFWTRDVHHNMTSDHRQRRESCVRTGGGQPRAYERVLPR